jgi:hypothetical protein
MGVLKDLYGIQAAFYALGAFAFLFSFALPAVHRWSLADRGAFPASEVR